MSNKPNPNRRGRRLNVVDWETSKRDEGTVWLDLGDAGEIEIEPPLFWERKLQQVENRDKLTNEQFQRVIIGDEAVDLWLSTGRTIAELDAAFTAAQGLDTGKSGASSKS